MNRIQKCNNQNSYKNNIGKYGWCYICQKKANYYCINTRVPICSPKCKLILFNLQQVIKDPFKKFRY